MYTKTFEVELNGEMYEVEAEVDNSQTFMFVEALNILHKKLDGTDSIVDFNAKLFDDIEQSIIVQLGG